MEQESGSIGQASVNSEIDLLLKRIARGDRVALMNLYDRTSRLLFGIVLKILGDTAAAEETLLEVFTQVWKQSGSYDPGLYTPLEWLAAVAHDQAIVRLHWSKHDKRKPPTVEIPVDSSTTVAPQPQQNARSLVASLSPIQREILNLAYYSGLNCGEIAAQIGKPIGAIKTHARLALTKMESALDFAPKHQNKPIPGDL